MTDRRLPSDDFDDRQHYGSVAGRLCEYSGVLLKDGLYRVFGRHHPKGRVIVLLRYWRRGRYWIKPPVHSPEAGSPELLSRYTVPTQYVPLYGRSLGVITESELSNACIFDPRARLRSLLAREKHSSPVATAVAAVPLVVQVSRSQLGIGGSRLLGVAGPQSDVDLLVYDTANAPSAIRERGRFIFPTKRHEHPSVDRFLERVSGAAAGMASRSIFNLIAPGSGIDLQYVASRKPVVFGSLGKLCEPEPFTGLCVIKYATGRHYYPSELVVECSGEEMLAISMDHVARFMLAGDIATIEGTVTHARGGAARLADRPVLTMDRILSVQCGAADPTG